jgi:predicted permease
VRSALGAGRVRLFRQLLTESVTLALMGALVGGALAGGIVTLLKAIGGHAVPRADAVTVGWRVYLFGVVAALIAAVVAGLLPAVRASAAHKLQGLEGTRTSASLGERRLLRSVATLQIVLTVALLSGAALLIRTASNLARVRPGYDTENILAMTVASVQQNTWKDFHARALDKLAALPGVTHTAFVWGLPLTGNKWTGDVEILGQPGTTGLDARINASLRAVTPDYFAAMGVSLAEGRSFQSTDDNGTPRVAIVNDAFAQRHLGGANPLGKQIRFPGAKETIDIVGSVSDIKTDALDARAEPEIYFPLWQMRAFSKHLILRAASDPRALGPLVRSALREIEPTAAVEHITTMAEIRRESLAPRTFAMRLLTAFAIVATVLALIGLYGVLSLSVASRTREIGVRQAIGAQRHEIVGLVLREGVRLIALGVLLGAGAALLAGRVLATLLFEVRPTDPLTLAGAAAVFCVVALGACSLPAWRASRVDIINALRHE